MAYYQIKVQGNEKLEELAQISFNLRHYTKVWQAHFGSVNRNNMKIWEVKMDNWLKENIEKEPEL